MKQLNTSVGTFGGFSNIETLSDRYRCDGVDYQFSVIGSATIEDYVPPTPTPVVPEEVTMFQAQRALEAAGLLTAAEAAIDAAGAVAQIEWRTKNAVHRHYGLVSDMGQALGLTDAQLDALFISAATF